MYQEYIQRLKDICTTKGYDLKRIGHVGTNPKYFLYRVVVNPENDHNTIGFSAGIHGDEKSGSLGILNFLEKYDSKPEDPRIVILPIVNPHGYEKNIRRNHNRVDMNRQFIKNPMIRHARIIYNSIKNYKFSVFTTLHEDDEVEGFYIYKYSKNNKFYEGVIAYVDKRWKVCKSRKIQGLPAKDGIIPIAKPDGSLEDRLYKDGLPIAGCIEIPPIYDLEKRTTIIENVIPQIVKQSAFPYKKQKTKYTCGPATIKMILQTQGIHKTEKALAKILRTSKVTGTKEERFRMVTDKYQLEHEEKENSTIAELRGKITNGFQVMVCYYCTKDRVGHYSLIKKITKKEIHFWDPWYGPNHKFQIKDFKKLWMNNEKGDNKKTGWFFAAKKPESNNS
ncbi:MAG: DUF2817 domain-containing protein [Nanoarchaeota archaeon]|nr:DUF2817 domain-containing protein [Nanoarchaeota archaeon]MCG2717924.1 DUF2817 domain-containing protein [Nanoarchaeota archaeon]